MLMNNAHFPFDYITVYFASFPNTVSSLLPPSLIPSSFSPHSLLLLSLPQACNPKYPDYDKTGSICISEHINDTLTRYRWLVSAPTSLDGVTSSMREVDFDTFFSSSKIITLDSVYFQVENTLSVNLY
jgi:hypothetical protein